LLSSLFHFSDEDSKAADLAFVGFPAIWNIVAFYVFALDVGVAATAVVIVVCVLATFVPLHWVHPVRVQPLKPITLGMTALWSVAALATIASGFPAPAWAQGVFVLVAIYGLGVTAWLSRRAS